MSAAKINLRVGALFLGLKRVLAVLFRKQSGIFYGGQEVLLRGQLLPLDPPPWLRHREEGNDDGSKWEARTAKTDMDEAGGREGEESLVKDQGSKRSNEMEERCESDRGGDEVYPPPATFGNEKTGLKLDRKKKTHSQNSKIRIISLMVAFSLK